MFKKFFVLSLLSFAVLVSYADKVWLSDGSVINGELQSIVDGKLNLKTDFAGEIVIEQNKVVKLETDTTFNAVMEDATRVSGKLQPSNVDGNFVIDGRSGLLSIENVKAVWSPDMNDPTLPPAPEGRKWAGEAFVDVAGKSGNTEKFTGGAGVKTTLTGPDDRLLLYANGGYSRENSVESEKYYRLGFDYEQSIVQTHNSWFVRTEFEKDEFSGIDYRTHVVAGYGYFFFKEEDTQLRLRLGASYLRKEYHGGYSDNAYGLDVNLHYERKIDEWGTWVTDLTYTPSLDETDDYRLYHESALDIPLLLSKPLSLRLGISNEYNNLVSPGTKRMDTTYFAKLVYKWK